MMAFFMAFVVAQGADVVVADFEGETYGAWTATGDAFGKGPARGTLLRQQAVGGFEGKGLVNTYLNADATQGTLTSPEFRIERKYINFLIGGGEHPEKACLNLVVDGKIVRTATGANDEMLSWNSFDVTEFLGKSARLEIVDRVTGGWGHVNVDQIVQSAKRVAVARERELHLDRAFLNLPVKNGAPKRRLALLVDGTAVREFEIELAADKPDFWVFLDVRPFLGKKAVLRSTTAVGLETVAVEDEKRGMENLYGEKHRPQFHFSSRRGWLNDPNGLVFHKGEWHLYYQHNPYGWKWGNMHWGHAVSRDLVRWEELPIAIYNHRFGDWAFSGSAVVDRENTAGWKKGDEDVIVAAYTSTGRGECIVYSNDRGRTFTEYEGNPVVKHEGRDPKIIFHAPTKNWVMAVYDELDKRQWIAFYTSADLKTWTFKSRIEGYYECPEIFEIPLDGDASRSKWIVYGADGAYAVGAFDGASFTTESGKHRFNWGNCFYASQTYSDVPPEDGRRIQIGWGRIDTPGMPFNQLMLFPCELTLRTTEEGPRLFAWPAREIASIRGAKRESKDAALVPGETILTGDLFDIVAELAVGDASEVGFDIRGIPVVYDVKARTLSCRKQTAPMSPVDGKIRLRLLVDRTSIEIFGNDGRVYMPVGAIPAEANRSLSLYSKGGAARVVSLEVWELKSTWKK